MKFSLGNFEFGRIAIVTLVPTVDGARSGSGSARGARPRQGRIEERHRG